MQKTAVISGTGLLRLNILLSVLAFALPFAVSGPQWLTGTLVNCLLFLSAAGFSKRSSLPVIVLPSIGALLHGVVFGPFTVLLIYFLPFIWMGNYLLVSVFSRLKNYGYFTRIAASSVVKFGLLTTSAYLFYGFKVVPGIFVSSMGPVQLATALTGGFLSYIIFRFINKYE